MGSVMFDLLRLEALLRKADRLMAGRKGHPHGVKLDALWDEYDALLGTLVRDGDTLQGARRKGGATRRRNASGATLDTRLAQVAREVWLANGRRWRRGDSDKIRRLANLGLHATDERIRRIKRAVEQE